MAAAAGGDAGNGARLEVDRDALDSPWSLATAAGVPLPSGQMLTSDVVDARSARLAELVGTLGERPAIEEANIRALLDGVGHVADPPLRSVEDDVSWLLQDLKLDDLTDGELDAMRASVSYKAMCREFYTVLRYGDSGKKVFRAVKKLDGSVLPRDVASVTQVLVAVHHPVDHALLAADAAAMLAEAPVPGDAPLQPRQAKEAYNAAFSKRDEVLDVKKKEARDALAGADKAMVADIIQKAADTGRLGARKGQGAPKGPGTSSGLGGGSAKKAGGLIGLARQADAKRKQANAEKTTAALAGRAGGALLPGSPNSLNGSSKGEDSFRGGGGGGGGAGGSGGSSKGEAGGGSGGSSKGAAAAAAGGAAAAGAGAGGVGGSSKVGRHVHFAPDVTQHSVDDDIVHVPRGSSAAREQRRDVLELRRQVEALTSQVLELRQLSGAHAASANPSQTPTSPSSAAAAAAGAAPGGDAEAAQHAGAAASQQQQQQTQMVHAAVEQALVAKLEPSMERVDRGAKIWAQLTHVALSAAVLVLARFIVHIYDRFTRDALTAGDPFA